MTLNEALEALSARLRAEADLAIGEAQDDEAYAHSKLALELIKYLKQLGLYREKRLDK
jgi:hypothetical protein